MGVASVVDLTAVRLSGSPGRTDESPGDFAGILGKTLDRTKERTRKGEESRKTGQQSAEETQNSEKSQDPDAEKTRASGPGRKGRPKTKEGGSAAEKEQTEDGQPEEKASGPVSLEAVMTALAGTGCTAPQAAVPAKATPVRTEGVIPAAAEPAAEPAASPGTGQIVENVLTELHRTGEAVREEQASLSPAAAETPQAGKVPQTEKTSQVPPAAAAATERPAAAAPKAEAPSAPKERPAELLSAEESPGAPTPAVFEQATNQQDSGRSGDSPKAPFTESGEKSGKVSKTPAEGSAAAASFSMPLSGRADRQAELNEISAALDQAIDRFRADVRGAESTSSSLRIALEPKELGALTITLASGENGVTAKIHTDSQEVANLIGDQMHQLIQNMEAKGVHVENVDVIYSGTAFQNFSGGSGNGQYGGNQTFHAAAPLFPAQSGQADALSSYESLVGYYASEDGLGESIEYRV